MTYNIAVCTVKKTPDDGQRNSPKHVEFYSKNKFEKLVNLFGFIIRIYIYIYIFFLLVSLNTNIHYPKSIYQPSTVLFYKIKHIFAKKYIKRKLRDCICL